jgi:exonuclease SbcD
MKILHTGDFHLTNRGTVAGRYVLRHGVNLTLWDRIAAVRRICDYAEEDPPDLIVIAGDLFDHANPENVAIKIAVEAVERLAETAPIVVIKGNHDGAKGSEFANALAPFGKSSRKNGVFISDRPAVIPIPLTPKTIVFTLPYPRKSALRSEPKYKNLSPEELGRSVGFKLEEILSGFTAEIEHDAINILVGHFTVAGGMYSKEQTVPPFDISVRKEFVDKFDLALLGHLHEPQPFYCGTIARSGFGEEDMKVGFKVYDVQPDKEVGVIRSDEEFVELPGRKYLTVKAADFLKSDGFLAGADSETVVRIKGRVQKFERDDIVKKIKELGLPFVQNAVEIESDTVKTEHGMSDEPTVEEAIRIWAKDKAGVDKFIEKVVEGGKEIEYRWRTGEGEDHVVSKS